MPHLLRATGTESGFFGTSLRGGVISVCFRHMYTMQKETVMMCMVLKHRCITGKDLGSFKSEINVKTQRFYIRRSLLFWVN